MKDLERRIIKIENAIQNIYDCISVLSLSATTFNNDIFSKVEQDEWSAKNVCDDVINHSECLDELAEIITADEEESELQNECLDESAECISELYERIEALEEIINGGK